MKLFIFILLLIISSHSFANLYIKTIYQEDQKKKVISTHHLFLNKKYILKYRKNRYDFMLKKISDKKATFEIEKFRIDDQGFKYLEGGSGGTFQLGESFVIKKPSFVLKIILEKIVKIDP
jgi:hypothetical protein